LGHEQGVLGPLACPLRLRSQRAGAEPRARSATHLEDVPGVRAAVVMARPEGVGRALATYRVPIEGRDEWLAAARRLA